MSRNIYTEIGCSQEDHLAHCSHFGYAGTYLSEHAAWCKTKGRTGPCICNPRARDERITALLPKIQECAKIDSVSNAISRYTGSGEVRILWDLPKLRQVLKEGL